jgi:hypothetical protein
MMAERMDGVGEREGVDVATAQCSRSSRMTGAPVALIQCVAL